ncbi:putative metal-binding protein [Desulfobotulus alkaliphilus]|uniref:Putative metal-binding protein n=1 Tax=Desulfobotulus alkaliphilus TaxID=622671 RepID=A0A562RQ31_9BACT|nr:DUF2284 domain-containing protein [Desulfobotulus alkaliphilus]TWI71122.1 putative metal-binding protein [Desulfobotulus alkaliphilus]
MTRQVRSHAPVVHPENPEFLSDISSRLMQEGAFATKIVKSSAILVDERVRMKCLIPLCDSYGKNLMCPPLVVPSFGFFRKALARYNAAILIQVKADLLKTDHFKKDLPDKPDETRKADIYAPAGKLHHLVNQAEKWAFEYRYRFALGLIGGCCRLCDECVALTGGTACRHPFKARPSMEAMGIDVLASLERAGLDTAAFPVADSVTWTGVLLV